MPASFRSTALLQAFALLLTLLCALPGPAAAAGVVEIRALDQPTSLAARWRFATDDDPAHAQPAFDDSGWAELQVPKPWDHQGYSGYAGIAWYRLHLNLSPELLAARAAGSELRLGVTLGRIQSAYELYAGGQKLGGVGGLPPREREEYDRYRTYEIPPTAIDADGHLVLAIRVWRGLHGGTAAGGLIEGPFRIGRLEDLTRLSTLDELPDLVLAFVFAVVGLYHLFLFRRRPELIALFWFGLFALNVMLYTTLRTQWRYAITDDFLLLKELEYVCLYLLPALGIACVWGLLGRSIRPWLRTLQLVFVGFAVVAGMPGLYLNQLTLPWWEAAAVLWILCTLWAVADEVRRGNPEARTIAIGVFLLMVAGSWDIAIDRAWIQSPRMAHFGFAAFVLSMAASLANRFTRTFVDLDDLRKNLENRVEQRTSELREANVHLDQQRQVADEQRQWADEQRRRAEEANRAKSVFLSNMSHELRTPLNAILGFAELMGRNRDRSAEDRERLGIMQRAGRHLLGLVNDVLSLSKIEAGRVNLEPAVFDLHVMLQSLEPLLRPRAHSKGLELTFEGVAALPRHVNGDQGKLNQVLINLLDNAIKFTAAGQVRLLTVWKDGRALFSVADTGPGISLDDQARLFGAFVQIPTGRDAQEGTGLGLAISRAFARLMGGDITVTSEPGKGSTFTCTLMLPLSESAAAATPATVRTVLGLAPGQRPLRVLVADDVADNRKLLVGIQAALGFSILEACNGAEAVEIWRRERPDLLWMDIRMPLMDGLEAARRIRDEEAAPGSGLARVTIVAVTASAFEHERTAFLETGFDAMLLKPFGAEEVFAALTTHLGVQFSYEEEQPPVDGHAAAAEQLAPERLGMMPRSWLEELAQALAESDREHALVVAQRMSERDADVAAKLRALLMAYDFDALDFTLKAALAGTASAETLPHP